MKQFIKLYFINDIEKKLNKLKVERIRFMIKRINILLK